MLSSRNLTNIPNESFDHIVDKIFSGILQIGIEEIKHAPLMIIIDGPAGIGKSTLAKYLYKQLKDRLHAQLKVVLLEQDLFGLQRSARIEHNIHPCSDAARDLELAKKADELLERKDISVPSYNKKTGHRIKNAKSKSAGDIIVYEGVSSLGLFFGRMEHKSQIAFKLFIQPENEDVLETSRQIRDTTERNVTEEEFRKEWKTSQAYNWIFTYRGRNEANLTVIRMEEKNPDGSVKFELLQVDDIQYQGDIINLGMKINHDLKLVWKKQRDAVLKNSEEAIEVFAKASLPIVERYLPGKNEAKQTLFDFVLNKQGLGNVVSMIGSMKKANARNGSVYKENEKLANSCYLKLVLQKGEKNTFNPAPFSVFETDGIKQQSVILNILEPSTIENPAMLNLSNLFLVIVNTNDLKNYLKEKKAESRKIHKILSYQKKLKEFYNPAHYYKLPHSNFALIQPTSPYFERQVLFADLRGNIPNFLQEKSLILNKAQKPLLRRRNSFSSSISTSSSSSSSSSSLFSAKRELKKRVSWKEEDIIEFLTRKRDLNIEEARQACEIVKAKMKNVQGHPSQSNASLMLDLLKDLNKQDVMGQNSPSAITDPNMTHIQCFNEEQSGVFPIFKTTHAVISNVPGGMCLLLNYPVIAFKFVFDYVDKDVIQFVHNLQNNFLLQNHNLDKQDQFDIALIGRKNEENKIELIMMARKDLRNHEDLVKKTASEVLYSDKTGEKLFLNKRPGFLELAGCFLQDDVQAYNVLTDDRITQMLVEYSAPPVCLSLFASCLEEELYDQSASLDNHVRGTSPHQSYP